MWGDVPKENQIARFFEHVLGDVTQNLISTITLLKKMQATVGSVLILEILFACKVPKFLLP